MVTNFPVVNIGSATRPVYLPMEVANVMEGNTMKVKLNGEQTAEMVNFACRRPKGNAESIVTHGRRILCLDGPDATEMVRP